MRTIFTALLIFTIIIPASAQTADSLYLMPRPQSTTIGAGRFLFSNKFTIGITGTVSTKLTAAVNRFYLQLGKRTAIYFPQEYITASDTKTVAQMIVRADKAVAAEIGADESYKLSISAGKISISAATDIGAMHGLETLYQLVMPSHDGYYCPCIEISDAPRFKWRGLMIDVARHFIPFEVLKRNIDAMAIVKMNVLHLHLSDDEGFRVESKVYPKLQEMGSNGFYYTQDQLKELVSYAHDRGIIIVPEFDLPGHCTSILAAYPFLASYAANYKPATRYKFDTLKTLNLGVIMKMISETATPTIDPAKESTYTFFDAFFKEMSGLFPDAYLHIGADENNGVAWKNNPGIVAFMKTKDIKSTDELQAYFVKRLHDIAKKYKKRIIGWEEAFNDGLPQDAIVQEWKPAAADVLSQTVIRHNNQLIVSRGYYLDMYFPAYIHYLTDPVSSNLSAAEADKGVLGAEAAIWSESVNGNNEEIRVWPRAAAIAERLWSAANVRDVDDMYRRLWMTDFELNDRAIEEYDNYIKILARWVNDDDLNPVLTLTNVYAQVKGYKRLMGAMLVAGAAHPNLSSPMVNIADVAHAESETRWYFRNAVAAYLKNHTAGDLAAIKSQLQRWQNNRARFNAVAAGSPYLQTITDLSDHLSDAAAIGLQALNGDGNKDELLKQLQQMEKPSHEVLLTILPEIEALVTGKLTAEPATYPLF
jgi:hexosaminidase